MHSLAQYDGRTDSSINKQRRSRHTNRWQSSCRGTEYTGMEHSRMQTTLGKAFAAGIPKKADLQGDCGRCALVPAEGDEDSIDTRII